MYKKTVVKSRFLIWIFFLYLCLMNPGGAAGRLFSPGLSGTTQKITPGQKSITSTIDSSCYQRSGIFTVPPNMLALNFKIRQLYQGHKCTTALPIAYKSFSIKTRDNIQTIYHFRQKNGDPPSENPGKLRNLVLIPGQYTLSVGGGAGAICELRYELTTESPPIPTDPNTVRSTVNNNCVQNCGEFSVLPNLAAQDFKLKRLDQGYGCGTGRRVDRQAFQIENLDTGEKLYNFVRRSGQQAGETPVRLNKLILRAGRYRLCVAGGKGAICVLSYTLANPPSPPPLPSSSLRSYVDNKCLQHCVEFTIQDYTVAHSFQMKKLGSGYNCHTGSKIDSRRFSIRNMDSDKLGFRLIWRTGQDPIETPVDLDQLRLKPGHYRMCVQGGKGAECILTYQLGQGSDRIPPRIKTRIKPPPTPPVVDKKDTDKKVDAAKIDKKRIEKALVGLAEQGKELALVMKVSDKWDDLIDRLNEIGIQIKILNQEAQVTSNQEQLDILKQQLNQSVQLFKETKDQLEELSSDSRFSEAVADYEIKELGGKTQEVEAKIKAFEEHCLKLANQLPQTELERKIQEFKDFDRFIKAATNEIEGRKNTWRSLEAGGGSVGISRRKKADFGSRDREIMREMGRLQKQIDKLDRMIGEYPDLDDEVKKIVSRICSLWPKSLDKLIKEQHGSRCKYEIIQCAQRRADGCWHFEWKGKCPSDPNAFNWYPIGSKGKICGFEALKARLKEIEDYLK